MDVECVVFEASDGVGGRVRTDSIEGFRLDRGFQILLTAYPQVRRRIDVDALGLARFEPGAVVRTATGMHRVSDPLRRPKDLPRTLFSPVGSLADKLRAARLVLDVRTHSVRDLLHRPDTSTARRLAAAGFSTAFISAFWQPLFAGIQLDPDLEVSSRRFETILRMLAVGSTGLPRDGMGAIPAQIAVALPADSVRLSSPVATVERGAVQLEDGERIGARAVVVATDGPSAHRLLGERVPDPGSRAAACCWYAVASAPRRGPYLMLDGEGTGPALNVVVMSEVQRSYAPAGRALIAAAVPGPGGARAEPGRARGSAARALVWRELQRPDASAHRCDPAWPARPAPAAESPSARRPRRRVIRVRRSPRHRLDPRRDVQRRADNGRGPAPPARKPRDSAGTVTPRSSGHSGSAVRANRPVHRTPPRTMIPRAGRMIKRRSRPVI